MNRLLWYTFLSILLVTALHFFATSFYLYWTNTWFDDIVHFSGGLSMGFLTFWIFRKVYPVMQPLGMWKVIAIVASFVLVIGIGWEIFEYVFGLALPGSLGGESYARDTTLDLVADTLGAITSAMIIWKSKLNG